MSRASPLPLLALLMVVASAARPQTPLTLIREDDFEQPDSRMLFCTGILFGAQHQDLEVTVDVQTTGGGLMSASPRGHKTDLVLRIVERKTGPASSHVALHAADGNARLNDEVWQILRNCAKHGF